jgi:hypothetical membrane protein
MSRATRIGAAAWVCSVQFFVAQAVVAWAWTTPFSLRDDYISDLGNTACGPFLVGRKELFVCSPWHAAMNASFLALGAGIALGAALVRAGFRPGWQREAGLALVGLAGLGLLLVGWYPEDINLAAHKAGAGVQFIGGNLGVVVLGWAAGRRWLARASFALGAAGLAATLLFVLEIYLGLGVGGMERVAAYALPVWTILAGASVTTDPPDA